MDDLRQNPRFHAAYQALAAVTLNPRRHTAANALDHSEVVAERAALLARHNQLDAVLLANLGRAHDLGKVSGSARPQLSLDVLQECGVSDERLLTLVKWHDCNLPWWQAAQKGQPPSPRAWTRLRQALDLRLLALFMVADRVDAPGGWRRNAPTRWFLDEARRHGLVDLRYDLPEHPSEISAGAALVRDRHVLLIDVGAGLELPKGGLEWDELPAEAAAREAGEESGVSAGDLRGELGSLDYDGGGYRKQVRYFAFAAGSEGQLPPRTRARRWLSRDEIASAPLAYPALRPLLARALQGAP